MPESIKLNQWRNFEIVPTAPFSFEGTFHKPSHYPTADICYEKNCHYQTMRLGEAHYGLKIIGQGTVSEPRLLVSVYYDGSRSSNPNFDAIISEIEYRFHLKADLRDFYSRFRSDDLLGPVLGRWRGMRVSTPYSLYEFLVVTTVLQNTVVRRSVQMMSNLFNRFGRLVGYGGKELSGFWLPDDIDNAEESELRGLKLGYRARTLKRQATVFASGEVVETDFHGMAKDRARKALIDIYGVGPATVQYILFEVLHHYNAYEHVPPWERKIFSRLLFNAELVDTGKILKKIDQRYGEWKMLALHYIFEDAFWQRKAGSVSWLDELVRL